MNKATKPLIDSLREWLQAIDDGDYERAMNIADHLSDNAEILKHCPEFERAADEYCKGMDAETATHSAAWMLMCISELLMRSPPPPGRSTPKHATLTAAFTPQDASLAGQIRKDHGL